MEIEFGKLINDYETKETITYWYDECINTLIRIFSDSNYPTLAMELDIK